MGWRRDNSFRDAVKKRGDKYSKQKDDKLTLVSSRHISLYNQKYKKNSGGYTFPGSDIIFLDNYPALFSFAHEMGHASRASRLCDEYDKKYWNLENLGHFIVGAQFGCPNPFPTCCNENDDCGEPYNFGCPGMPYDPDWNSPQPNYKKEFIGGVLSNFPKYFSIMGIASIKVSGLTIYPIEAQCPLRNCR